eukprot:g1335.t1
MSRSHTIETLASQGVVKIEDFVIINEQTYDNFKLRASTELYNEWPFSVLPHVPEEIADNVILPLLAIRDYEDAALIGDHAGFVNAGDFSRESNVNFALDMNKPQGICTPGSKRDTTHPLVQPCVKCVAGRFNTDGLSECRACSPGYFSSKEGASKCTKCPEGLYSTSFGSTSCMDTADSFEYDPIEACASFPNKTLTIYVAAAEETVELTDQRWRPTFDTVINNYMNRFKCYFNMIALTLPNLKIALEQGKVDFIYCDSGVYTLFKHSHGARALATSLRTYLGRAYIQEAGAIYRKKGSNDDLFTLEDLQVHAWARNLTLCPLAHIAFSGNQAQRYEFFKRGMDVREIFPRIVFSGGHEESVRMVNRGECDVGMSRSHTIETLASQGVVKIEDFVIINEQTYDNFKLRASTELYNEWPFSVLPHVPEEIADNAMLPLLAIRDYEDAALIGVCAPGSKRDTTHPLVQPCVKCVAGRFNTDCFVCRACEPGSFSSEAGATSCTACPADTTTSAFGSTFCVKDTKPIEACEQFPNNTLTIGMLSLDASVDETLRLWRPTFENTVNEHTEHSACSFRLEALTRDQLVSAVAAGRVDLVFADPGSFSIFSRSAGASAFVSVVRFYAGKSYTQQGGVIVRRSDTHTGINMLQELRAASQSQPLTACAVGPYSFNGWLVQWYELFANGLDVKEVFTNVVNTGSHQESVHKVMRRECEIGMASSQTISELASSGVYAGEDLTIINAQVYSGFTQQISTKLYATWPIAALPHVAKEILAEIKIPLFGMQYSPAAALARHAGFALPASHEKETDVLYQLNMMDPALFACAPGSSRHVEEFLQPCLPCALGRANYDGLDDCRACQARRQMQNAQAVIVSFCVLKKAQTATYGNLWSA